MDSINRLIMEYNQLSEDIKLESDQTIKNELQGKLNGLTSKIREELKNEQLRGNNSEEFIRLSSAFDATSTLDDKNKKEEVVVEEESYTLSSDKIISKYTGEEINLSDLSRIDKIKTIYDHTGIEISNEDPRIITSCEQGFQKFLRGCSPSIYIQKYGENWQKEVEQIYKSTYLSTVQRCIANGLNEVDEKNREKEKLLTLELEKSEQEKEQLMSEIDSLKEEVRELNDEMQLIHEERKNELVHYKEAILELSKNKPSTYQDETIRKDVDFNEYDRYTTYRSNRASETGMQERVNDIAHVHDPLSTNEIDRMKTESAFTNVSDEDFRKYQEENGIYQDNDTYSFEEKPKSM